MGNWFIKGEFETCVRMEFSTMKISGQRQHYNFIYLFPVKFELFPLKIKKKLSRSNKYSLSLKNGKIHMYMFILCQNGKMLSVCCAKSADTFRKINFWLLLININLLDNHKMRYCGGFCCIFFIDNNTWSLSFSTKMLETLLNVISIKLIFVEFLNFIRKREMHL